jgi:hypothetical protein
MTRFLMIEILPYAGHLPVHNYTLFIVFSIECGASQSIYRGVYLVGGYNEGYLFQHGWQRNLPIGPPLP